MTLRILTTALTSAALLRTQARALERHVVGEYQLLVVNDAYVEPHFSNHWRKRIPDAIRAAARSVDARYVRFPQHLHEERWVIFGEGAEQAHNANTRCADAVQYGVNLLLGESDEPLLILDADMIPVDHFDWQEWLARYPIWGVHENRGPGIDYLWNGIILVDPRRARAMDRFDLNCGREDCVPVDVGGMLRDFRQANLDQIGEIKRLYAVPWLDGFELCGGVFAHLRGGGNWQVREPDEAQERLGRFVALVNAT